MNLWLYYKCSLQHSPLDGVDHLIRLWIALSEPSAFVRMLRSTFACGFLFRRLSLVLTPTTRSWIVFFYVFTWPSRESIASLELASVLYEKRGTEFRTFDPWRRETYFVFTWRISPPDHGTPLPTIIDCILAAKY